MTSNPAYVGHSETIEATAETMIPCSSGIPQSYDDFGTENNPAYLSASPLLHEQADSSITSASGSLRSADAPASEESCVKNNLVYLSAGSLRRARDSNNVDIDVVNLAYLSGDALNGRMPEQGTSSEAVSTNDNPLPLPPRTYRKDLDMRCELETLA